MHHEIPSGYPVILCWYLNIINGMFNLRWGRLKCISTPYVSLSTIWQQLCRLWYTYGGGDWKFLPSDYTIWSFVLFLKLVNQSSSTFPVVLWSVQDKLARQDISPILHFRKWFSVIAICYITFIYNYFSFNIKKQCCESTNRHSSCTD